MAQMNSAKAGRYELIEEIGRGAMGVVFKAFDPILGRTVAVKTMRLTEMGTGLPRPELILRFQNEARAAGKLVHPNIVVVHDAGEDQGLYYITMEFIEGRSLQSLLDLKRPIPLPRTLRIVEQVCSALEYAHQRSIVHRDIKPANIVLTAEDTVKITDFGIAKILSLNTTTTGAIVGTPSYMSPEQVRGKAVDGRSDIFSFGVILFELVTGEKPFPGDTITTIIYKIVHEEPVSPREISSSIDSGLCEVVLKALAKHPDARYQTCSDFLQDLQNRCSFEKLGGAAPRPLAPRPRVTSAPGQAAPAQPRSGWDAAAESRAPAAPARIVETPPKRETKPAARPKLPAPKTSPWLLGSIAGGILVIACFLFWSGVKDFLVPALHEMVSTRSTAPTLGVAQQPAEKPAEKSLPGPQAASSQAKSTDSDGARESAAETKEPRFPATRESAVTPGEVQIVTEASGARAVLQGPAGQGSEECITPCRFGSLAAGRYALEITKSGFRTERRILNVSPGESSNVSVKLQAALGLLQVVSRPEGADIFVDGVRRGQTPATLSLPAGIHRIRLHKDGGEPYETTVQLAEEDFKTLTVSGFAERGAAARDAGWLDVRTVPPGADVLVDNINTGRKTPVRIELSAGQHSLTLYLKGHQTVREQIVVAASQTLQLNRTLQPQ
jgi:serine/threonine-protein kinase